MGLSVVITTPPDREWFTSSESVRGAVVWDKPSSSTVSRIVVRLEGQLKLVFRSSSHQRHPSGPAPHILFARETVVLPVSSNGQQLQQGVRSTLAAGSHRFPFTLKFPKSDNVSPAKNMGCSHCSKALPSSLRVNADAFSGSVVYVVRAIVERDQLLRSNLNATSEVEFRPLLPTTALLIDQPWKVTEQVTAEPVEGGRQSEDQSAEVNFEMAFPPSRIVRPGNNIDIGMTLDIPTDQQRRWGHIYVFRVVVRLKSTTKIQNGQQIRSHSNHTDACNVRGLFPLQLPGEYARITIPPHLWQHHLYPSILPSIALCKMQRAHNLEVLLSFIADSRQYSVSTNIDVTVESGAMLPSDAPPAYS